MAKLSPLKPLLFLLYGFPGSGKTRFARQLTEHVNCVHVQTDKLQSELFGNSNDAPKDIALVKRLTNYMTEQFLSSGVSVIYDEGVERFGKRQALRTIARKHKAEPVLIWLQTDAESAYARIEQRDKRRPDDRYAKKYTRSSFNEVAASMQNPKNEEFIVISGKHAFSAQKNAVVRRLLEKGLILNTTAQSNFAKPGMINLVPQVNQGRVDLSRRNITIR